MFQDINLKFEHVILHFILYCALHDFLFRKFIIQLNKKPSKEQIKFNT